MLNLCCRVMPWRRRLKPRVSDKKTRFCVGRRLLGQYNGMGGESMKKMILLSFIIVLIFVPVRWVEASWQVHISNSCAQDVSISVMGEHLFWRQVDCTVKVKAGSTGTCEMPGLICPATIFGDYEVSNQTYHMNDLKCVASGACCCWNVNVEVMPYGGMDCRLELR